MDRDIAATGLPTSKKLFTNATAFGLHPQGIRIDDTAGQ
ncbi:hypothetical protein ACVWZK_009090 [Bradyrhizobium sp. GM0.4]